MVEPLTEIEREALELAHNKCSEYAGMVKLEHVFAWKELLERGLVKHVRIRGGSRYAITPEGQKVLEEKQ